MDVIVKVKYIYLREVILYYYLFLQLEIQAPPGTVVGYVAQKWDPFLPKFTIQNANREDILDIVGPCTTCGCFGDVDFEV